MKFAAILFDFNGVLCRDHFYKKTLLPERQDVYDWIQENIIFDEEFVESWMRGKTTWQQVNERVAFATGIDKNVLDEKFLESVRSMEIDQRLIDLVGSLKQSGTMVGLVTDNMDVFTDVTVSHHGLAEIFDVVVNSADHGFLKKERDGKLFDIALTILGKEVKESLMVDDSPATIELFKRKGGDAFLYEDYDDLAVFLDISEPPLPRGRQIAS